MKVTREITNNEDVIDSRDVIERIKTLENIFLDEEDASDEEALAELTSLKALAEQGEISPDWHWGESLIRDDYFEEYAQQLAEDLGVLDRDLNWPLNCIDWKEAAEQLQQYYINVTFDGVDYWIRR